MKHIDVYIYQNILSHRFTGFSQDIIRQMLEKSINYPISKEDYKRLFIYKSPSSHELAHRLSQMGFAPKTIANFLDITPQTVSYHLSRPLKREYINPLIRYFEDEVKEKEFKKLYPQAEFLPQK